MAAGYKDFTAGAVLTAADLEDYNQNQSIMRFASAAARDSALSVVKTEGMYAYLIDVNTMTVYSGSAWSTIGPVHGALTTWTPAVVQGVAVTSTNNGSKYWRVGRMVWASFVVTATSAGTAANEITVSLPVAAVYLPHWLPSGVGDINDVSATDTRRGDTVLASANTLKFRTNLSGAALFLGTSSITLASGDVLSGTIMFEASGDA